MRTRQLFLSAALLSALSVSTVAAAAEAMAGDCWHAAFVASDADAVAHCYAPDAIMWFPGGPMAKGGEAIRDGYAGFFANSTIKSATLTQLGSTVHGDDAVTWGTYVIVMVAKDSGKETTEVGRYTDVQKKIGGHWKYVVDHASDDPAPTAPNAPEPTANG